MDVGALERPAEPEPEKSSSEKAKSDVRMADAGKSGEVPSEMNTEVTSKKRTRKGEAPTYSYELLKLKRIRTTDQP